MEELEKLLEKKRRELIAEKMFSTEREITDLELSIKGIEEHLRYLNNVKLNKKLDRQGKHLTGRLKINLSRFGVYA